MTEEAGTYNAGAYIGWARVSTDSQSLEQQVSKLQDMGCTKIFQGKRSGASKENAAVLADMLDYCRGGDTVVTTKLDRLGRSLTQVLGVIEQLQEKNVQVKFLEQNLDTNLKDPMNKAFLQLLGMFSELERNFIVTRTQEGRIASGNLGGRPNKLSPDQQKVITKSLKKGSSVRSLAGEYKVARATISKLKD